MLSPGEISQTITKRKGINSIYTEVKSDLEFLLLLLECAGAQGLRLNTPLIHHL